MTKKEKKKLEMFLKWLKEYRKKMAKLQPKELPGWLRGYTPHCPNCMRAYANYEEKTKEKWWWHCERCGHKWRPGKILRQGKTRKEKK